MSTDKNDTSAHPLYYTETYHRAQVDKDVYGLVSGVGGGLAGAAIGAATAGSIVNAASNSADKLMAVSAGQEWVKPATSLWKEFGKGERWMFRGSTALTGAVVLGLTAAAVGSAVGYIHAIAKGPRAQQLNGWQGKITGERANADSEKTR